ncbi:MAG TPA: ABC transporter permease [Caulobacteraceae bacterium]
MNLLAQIWAVTAMNVRGLPQRLGASLVTVIGVACAVAVMISLLAIGAGLVRAANKHARADRAVVTSSGAASEYMGAITRGEAAIIAEAPGVKTDPAGQPMVSPAVTVIVEVSKKDGSGTANIGFEGAVPESRVMDPTLRLVAGRMFRPALHELIVGRAARAQFKDLDVGDHISLRGVDWTVVGAFEDEGALTENAIIADADTVLAAFDRTAYQSVVVQLDSAADFTRFRDALTTNPQLKVEVKRDTEYRREQLSQITSILDAIGYFVGVVMGIGAIFGAINTMYSAVDARAREIATLRAIGFGGTAVVASVMAESLLLAIPGAILGVLTAWALFNNHAISTVGITFPLAVTPALVQAGVTLAIVIGLIGGLAPSVRAARLPVATALRAT